MTFPSFALCILAAVHALRRSCSLRLLLCAYTVSLLQTVTKNMKLKEVAGMGLCRVLKRSEKGPLIAKMIKNGYKVRFFVDVSSHIYSSYMSLRR